MRILSRGSGENVPIFLLEQLNGVTLPEYCIKIEQTEVDNKVRLERSGKLHCSRVWESMFG